MQNFKKIKDNNKFEEFEAQKELKNWEKWVKIRKEEATKLAKKTGRPPADLAMNLLEKVREDKEEKITLENATIDEKPKLRGELWEQPKRLKQRCYCEPVYEIKRTQAEMGNPGVIEHIGVPNYIQVTEKGASGEPQRIVCKKLDFEYKQYKTEKKLQLQEKIKKIDPFRSDITDLIIKGHRPKPPPTSKPILPVITVTDAIKYDYSINNIHAIKINNTVIFKNIPGQDLQCLRRMQEEAWHEPCTSWMYYFKVPVKKIGRSKLILQNLGTVTLRYCWKKIKYPIPLIPEGVYEQAFFFNKNEDVIFPGYKNELFLTFLSDKPGMFQEFWELVLCNVTILDTPYQLIINLYADAYEDIGPRNAAIEELKSNINHESLKNIARIFINEVMDTAATTTPRMYPYKEMILESELFVMKNPVCFYHQTEVLTMKSLYTEMERNKTWDLSISSWRDAMMAKEFDDRMKYYELLRISHDALLKPWYEIEDIAKEKHSAVKLLVGELADALDKEFARVLTTYVSKDQVISTPDTAMKSRQRFSFTDSINAVTLNTVHNVFYIRAAEHVARTMEMCAGILSSLDLNRWIEFDFCH